MNKELKINIFMVSVFITIGLIFGAASDYGHSTVDLLIGYIIGIFIIITDIWLRKP